MSVGKNILKEYLQKFVDIQISAYICSVIKTNQKMYTNNNLISEVEKNQKLVRVNDVLFYVDNANSQRWNVVELFEGGFVAKDDYEEKVFFFCELQHGWTFSEKTKEQNSLNHRIRYAD